MIKVYDADIKTGKGWAVKLRQLVKDAELVAVDAVTGAVVADLESITADGVFRPACAKDVLDGAGYDTSNTKWDSNGALAIYQKER